MKLNYVLGGEDGHTPIPEPNMTKWLAWFGKAERQVLRDEFPNGITVSTVFLGTDHGWGIAPPLLFETMIFPSDRYEYQTRCSTWKEAEAMHMRALAYLREGASPE
jgi:hypothetical protein